MTVHGDACEGPAVVSCIVALLFHETEIGSCEPLTWIFMVFLATCGPLKPVYEVRITVNFFLQNVPFVRVSGTGGTMVPEGAPCGFS